MPEKVYFDAMHGIGDNINQRCFIKALAEKGKEIWLKTPLPEIYAGIPNLHFVKANTPLRTQQKNELTSSVAFEPEPPGVARQRVFYGNGHLQKGSVFDAMQQQFGTEPAMMDLPHYAQPNISIPDGKPLAITRYQSSDRTTKDISRSIENWPIPH